MNAQFKEIAKEAFIIAYKENFGNITISCEASGIGRTQYKTWLKDDPEFAKKLDKVFKSAEFQQYLYKAVTDQAQTSNGKTISLKVAK
jgi:hypothetical protein